MRFHEFDNRIEHRRVRNRKLAEHLTIEFDTRGRQGGDEAVVAHAALLEGSIEARDPQRAEVSLFLATIAVGISIGAMDEFQRLTINRSRTRAKSTGAAKDTFAFATVSRAAG